MYYRAKFKCRIGIINILLITFKGIFLFYMHYYMMHVYTFFYREHSCETPSINAALGEAMRKARHDGRSRRKQLVRVNELASKRAGEFELAIMTNSPCAIP
jgi:hypothetical protein